MQTFYFHLNLSAQEIINYYQGNATSLSVVTNEGLRIEFPLLHLRRFVGINGVKGYFCLTSENNKFVSLEKIN